MKPCPVTDCDADELLDDTDLEDHLFREHDEEELAATVVRLAKAVDSAHANTECQRCGNYGATPGDHPLCGTCEKEISG
ncbi:hypothetical protein [Streptomyces sp. CB03911]|uniref:hypothetical protein n=1 Tax=Streptomyces sp. CB03911 TaxID=1804758 RepID=UPI000939F960|nr:hypothetical protein [Streptomyces sp. CB03911]OKI16574.1 hypothetical protein A6A07_11235 [Streptomyces sp. CB03911]